MSFIANKQNGLAVLPGEIGDTFTRETALTCPHCSGEMHFRAKSVDKQGNIVRRAHFAHTSESVAIGSGPGGCAAGGESAEHEEIKHNVGEKLKEKYQGDLFIEKSVGHRVADALFKFSEEHPELGEGIVVEVQNKHKDKGYISTTRDYLEANFSVLWVFYQDMEMAKEAKEELSPILKGPSEIGHLKSTAVGKIPNPITPSSLQVSRDTLSDGVIEMLPDSISDGIEFTPKTSLREFGKNTPSEFYLYEPEQILFQISAKKTRDAFNEKEFRVTLGIVGDEKITEEVTFSTDPSPIVDDMPLKRLLPLIEDGDFKYCQLDGVNVFRLARIIESQKNWDTSENIAELAYQPKSRTYDREKRESTEEMLRKIWESKEETN